MTTFKIRDLMIAVRQNAGAAGRPLDCDGESGVCDGVFSLQCDGVSIQCDIAPLDTGGPGGGLCNASCRDSCGCTQGPTDPCQCTYCTAGCTATCGCTLASCGPTCGRSCAGVSQVCAAPSRQANFVTAMGVDDLERLKTQLRSTMKMINQREQVLAAAADRRAMEPQTVEQIDALEKMMSEAMDELRARRLKISQADKARADEAHG
jgi:hypothetical protein